MITASQIRSARALLDRSQHDVAQACGIQNTTLSAIEKGRSPGTTKTFKLLEAYFVNRGLEFIEGDGVRRALGGVRSFQGSVEFREFFDDIYETAKSDGGNICLFNGVPSLLTKWLGDDFYAMHAKRMEKIKRNFNFRVIVEESDTNFVGATFAMYRWFSPELFRDRTIYIYGGKVGIITFCEDDVQVAVIDQADFADSQRTLFDIAWDHVAQEVAS